MNRSTIDLWVGIFVTIGFAALRSGFGPVPPAEGRSGRA